MSRWRAAGIHLGISALIATLVLMVIYLVWYPSPYFTAMGGDQLVLLIIGVDVVIGPLITLVIFKAGKKGLKYDLASIAFFQAAALTYGVMVTAQARPVYSVFVIDRFEVVAANDIDDVELAKVVKSEYKSLPWTGPRVVGVAKPADPEESNRILFSMTEGKDLQHFPQHFVPYAQIRADVARRAQPLSDLRRYNGANTSRIDAFLYSKGLKEDDVAFVPMRAKRGERAVIVMKEGDIVGALDMNPWGI